MEDLHTGNCITTFTGLSLDVFNPDSKAISIYDIAHGLSNVCRWAGHTPHFFSVAQHSIMCARKIDPSLKLNALLHDASEAYLGDMPKPIKKRLPDYQNVEEKLMICISTVFGVEYPIHPEVKRIDKHQLIYEHNVFSGIDSYDTSFEYWSPEYAKRIFLKTFFEITNITPIV